MFKKGYTLNRKHSYKHPHGKRRTQFKSGNLGKQKQNLPNTNTDLSTPDLQLQRLNTSEARDVLYISENVNQDTTTESTLPYTLRPQSENENNMETGDRDENIIVNIEKLRQLIQVIHQCDCPSITVNIDNRKGLHVMLSAVCSSCKFKTSSIEMSDTITKSRGPSSGALNDMLLLPVLKSKAGIEDVLLTMSCLNIRPPSKQCLQAKLNKLSEKVKALNEQAMVENQRHIKRMSEIAGTSNAVDIQFDVSFSRRPRGGFEAAQQSFGVAIDHSTSRPLPIATAIANKHCRRKNCNHTSSNCTKTYQKEASIASSERSLLHESLDTITDSGLVKIRSVTTDASTQVAKALRDYKEEKKLQFEHYKCFVHRLRTLEKNIRSLKLRSIPRQYTKTLYMQKLGACIRARIRLELQNLRSLKQAGHNFVHRGCLAIQFITRCLSGNHRFCRQNSTVCIHHLQHYTTKALPYGVHLELNNADLCTIQAEINRIFCADGLKSLCKLFNTNMCESMHASVYNLAPKSTCWSRNFNGLCHSATHSRTLGQGVATILLAKAAGIKVKKRSEIFVQLKRRDSLKTYHATRKSLPKYKNSRYFLRKRTASRIQSSFSDGFDRKYAKR